MKFSRFVTGVVAVALIALMVSDASAQGRRGQGGGRGGPGGFGGGPGGPGGFGGFGGRGGGDNKLGLLRIEEVQTELEVSPAQEEAIGKLLEQSRGERPDFAGVQEMSDSERQAFFEKMRKEAEERTKEMNAQLEEVLLPEQLARLDQISLQVRGVQALEDEEVAAKLKITAEQKAKLTEVRDALQEKMRERMREMFQAGGGPGGGGDFREAMTKFREESEKEILAVLTTDQQKQFEEMKGEKFDMPEGGFGGFGGRGPGGPGGPGGQQGFGGRGRGGRPQPENN